MTKRKPSGVSWESWTERQIRNAQEGGKFDDLPGEGRPLANLGDAHDPAWWAKQLVRREGVSVLPPALEIRRDVERALERIAVLRSESDVRSVIDEVNARIRKLNAGASKGPPTSVAPLDADRVVADWKKRDSGG